ncbi:MAG: hypothetical protein PHN37_00775 [Candidatus Pacebacteria bacterium]|nr:hypothetical protein [Candidatus Paceibacterota bacterium]
MKKIIFILILIISLTFFWRKIEEQVNTWDNIEIPEIVLEKDIEETTLEEIIKDNALFNNYEYYLEDLNKDGFLEVLIISLSPEKSTAEFLLLSLTDKKGSFDKKGSLVLEKEFLGTPFVIKTQDIKKNNVQEIVVDLNTGGVATQTHGILEWQDGLKLVIIEKQGEKKEAVFLIGSSALHHQFYYLKDREIIEIIAWQEQELICEINVYELKNNIFIFNKEKSDELLKKAGDDCLLEND